MNTLLDRALHSNPVLDGDRVTFVWQGDSPPQLIGDMTEWEWGSPIELTQVDPDVWTHTLTLPQDAYIEYAFWDGQQRVTDPLNGNVTPNGLGHENHYLYMPGAEDAGLTPVHADRLRSPCGALTPEPVGLCSLRPPALAAGT